METIIQFCKDAERCYFSTEEIKSLKEVKLKLSITDNEVYRIRYNTDGSSLFLFSMNCSKTDLKTQMHHMQSIEMFYPDTFSWRYDGDELQAIALIPMRTELLGIFNRYNGIDNFIKLLRARLLTVLKYRDYTENYTVKIIDDKILSTGSINKRVNMFCVDILPSYTEELILTASQKRVMLGYSPKELNMKYWVREMNPDFYKERPARGGKRYPLTDDVFTKYPAAIKKIAAMPTKLNPNRFLLATYLLSVHTERDAKHQLDMMLSDDERKHMEKEGQWRVIVAKGYSAPSPKTLIDSGFAATIADCLDSFEEGTHEEA